MNNQQTLCKEFGVIKIIFPETYSDSYNLQNDDIIMCSNMTILVISAMAMAIIITNHDMKQFEYYNKLKDYNELKRFKNIGAEIVIINSKWDTSKWNLYSLGWLPYWVGQLHLMSLQQIQHENKISNNKRNPTYSIDVEFLKAMSWVGLK